MEILLDDGWSGNGCLGEMDPPDVVDRGPVQPRLYIWASMFPCIGQPRPQPRWALSQEDSSYVPAFSCTFLALFFSDVCVPDFTESYLCNFSPIFLGAGF